MYVSYSKMAFCRLTGLVTLLHARNLAGYSEASLSGASTVALTAPGKVSLSCSSSEVLTGSQIPGANGTLIATKVGAINTQSGA
ncbi:hypothetical protein J4573_04920 [Actinomadura barringtoniae]|uniref:Uncharacterized protein n=1 Tax=Actinomadura barringtoniae TaxID=1427535 RepID=A0A939P6N0_9ACTN|nr:hypothetical protein [Actinomadura barringtoniae]MBO2446420.1 hypothetical protein [Actinomadura barringtoniae]